MEWERRIEKNVWIIKRKKKSLIGTFNITLIHYYRHYWIYGKRISDWLQFCPNVQRNKTRKYTPVPVIHFRFCIVPRSSSSVARSHILRFHLIIFSFSYLSFSCSYGTAYFVTIISFCCFLIITVTCDYFVPNICSYVIQLSG